METPKNCPGCGADLAAEKPWLSSTCGELVRIYTCGSRFLLDGQTAYETHGCLRNQLAAVKSERDEARAALARCLEYLDYLGGDDHEPIAFAGVTAEVRSIIERGE